MVPCWLRAHWGMVLAPRMKLVWDVQRDFWAWGDPNLILLGLGEWLHPYGQSHIHVLWTRAKTAKKLLAPGNRIEVLICSQLWEY